MSDLPPGGRTVTRRRFSHEDLRAYQESLAFVAMAQDLVSSWERQHAITDHLSRASESIIVNIAEGNGRFAQLDHCRFLSIANRAAVRLAAHLDVCAARGLLEEAAIDEAMELLLRIGEMTAAMCE